MMINTCTHTYTQNSPGISKEWHSDYDTIGGKFCSLSLKREIRIKRYGSWSGSAEEPWFSKQNKFHAPVRQKLCRAGLTGNWHRKTEQKPNEKKQGNIIAPEWEWAWAPGCSQGMCVPEYPSSERSSNARTLDAQNPGSHPAPCHPLSRVPFVGHNLYSQTLQAWGDLMDEKRGSIDTCCFWFGIFFDEMGFS